MILDRDLPVLHIAAQSATLGPHGHPTDSINALLAALAARSADSDVPIWIAFLEGFEDEVVSGHRMVAKEGVEPSRLSRFE